MTAKSFPKSVIVALLAALALLCTAPYAQAQSSSGTDAVGVVVYVIKASDGVPGVDPAIKHIVKQFHESFRYSTYKLVKKVPKKIPLRSVTKIKLPGDRELYLSALGVEGSRIKLRVRIAEKASGGKSRDALNTEFKLAKGGTIGIGGYDYKKGKLILAISADK
jgi:hypothetical protein